MTPSVTYQEAIGLAEHYRAIGIKDIYLYDVEFPWEWVTKATPGNSGRFDMRVSINFEAAHECGLTFRWWFDMESPEANGTRHYQIRVGALADVMGRLHPFIWAQLHEFLGQWVGALRKRGEEYMEFAENQFGQAMALERLISK